MNSDTLGILALFAFMAGFATFFFFIIYKMVKAFGGKMEGKSSSFTQQWTKEQLDTVVTLTDDDKRSMNRTAMIGLVIATLICGVGFTSVSATYWKYVVQGEKISATVTDVESYRSGGKRKRKYLYTLEATVNGTVVRDTYRAGSYRSADVGDVIDVYFVDDTDPELAIAAVEERGPFWLLFFVVFYGVILFAMRKQRKDVASGRMKIGRLPKAMRRKKFMELEKPKTSEGKPMYSIGGSEQSRPRSNDGSDYRVS